MISVVEALFTGDICACALEVGSWGIVFLSR